VLGSGSALVYLAPRRAVWFYRSRNRKRGNARRRVAPFLFSLESDGKALKWAVHLTPALHGEHSSAPEPEGAAAEVLILQELTNGADGRI
jgi:hypothetical protein